MSEYSIDVRTYIAEYCIHVRISGQAERWSAVTSTSLSMYQNQVPLHMSVKGGQVHCITVTLTSTSMPF
jgi:hypothetical protein